MKHTSLFCIYLLLFLGGYCQTATISGKVQLKDPENREAIIRNTYIILSSKTSIDTTKLDKDLHFTFNHLPADSFRISFSPHSYPYDIIFVIKLKDGEQFQKTFDYSSTCPYGKAINNTCPACRKNDRVIPIVYGLLATRKRDGNKKVRAGGCIMSECMPYLFCERDSTEF